MFAVIPVVTSIIVDVPSSLGFLSPFAPNVYRADALTFNNRLIAFTIAQPKVTEDGVQLYQVLSNRRDRIDNCSISTVDDSISCYFPPFNVSTSNLMFELVVNNSIGMVSRSFMLIVQGKFLICVVHGILFMPLVVTYRVLKGGTGIFPPPPFPR